jgi:hypothetical protein
MSRSESGVVNAVMRRFVILCLIDVLFPAKAGNDAEETVRQSMN